MSTEPTDPPEAYTRVGWRKIRNGSWERYAPGEPEVVPWRKFRENLGDHVRRAEGGEKFVITRHGIRTAQLGPCEVSEVRVPCEPFEVPKIRT